MSLQELEDIRLYLKGRIPLEEIERVGIPEGIDRMHCFYVTDVVFECSYKPKGHNKAQKSVHARNSRARG